MYSVFYDKRVFKELDRLPKKEVEKIGNRFIALASIPLPLGVEKLAGGTGMYRIRQGDYRILYTVDHPHKKVCIHRVGNRKEVYRRF